MSVSVFVYSCLLVCVTCVHICLHGYACLCLYLCVCVCAFLFVYSCVLICVYMCVCVSTGLCVCVCAYISVYVCSVRVFRSHLYRYGFVHYSSLNVDICVIISLYVIRTHLRVCESKRETEREGEERRGVEKER